MADAWRQLGSQHGVVVVQSSGTGMETLPNSELACCRDLLLSRAL